MDFNSLLELIVGPLGAVVVLCIGVFYLYRENKRLRTELDEERDERLKELKEGEMMARAYLRLRSDKDLEHLNDNDG